MGVYRHRRTGLAEIVERASAKKKSNRGVQTIQYQVVTLDDNQRSGSLCDGIYVPERGKGPSA